MNMGKPITRATGDIAACVNCTKWYAEAIDKLYDDVAPTGDNLIATITKEPLGVVGAVTPEFSPTNGLLEICACSCNRE